MISLLATTTETTTNFKTIKRALEFKIMTQADDDEFACNAMALTSSRDCLAIVCLHSGFCERSCDVTMRRWMDVDGHNCSFNKTTLAHETQRKKTRKISALLFSSSSFSSSFLFFLLLSYCCVLSCCKVHLFVCLLCVFLSFSSSSRLF